MKDFEMLRNFLSEKIHDADNRSFDTNAATLEIYFDDMGFFTASGEWADVQLLMTVDYKKIPIYGTYEDRYGDSHREVNAVTLEEESRDIAIISIKIGGRACNALQAYADELLQDIEVATKKELQEMEWSIDDFSDFDNEEENTYDDWYDGERDRRLLAQAIA